MAPTKASKNRTNEGELGGSLGLCEEVTRSRAKGRVGVRMGLGFDGDGP